ncbi:MAG: CDP-diacylglycerol--serine O-phosphatidyltransferase [Prevotella sp.]|nr:CDP-diacylglycerol--serine O-phosphatidyltransferase [Prevotella sp.]MDY3251429.1 CDP-diacylglycerol--serine O-phosphatidyltransferase [Prevotella sp.]MDY4554640.1 CDP-diacylglycerol--serine O-phosphatidyltransferase [Prevotella sp.]
MANIVTKHIPNTLTSCNLISGCIAIVFALSANYTMALTFIVVGAVFDFFDGMSARLLGVSSPIGKELDSLADVVTFGVAPSSMIYTLLLTLSKSGWNETLAFAIPYVAFVMAAFSALRLAKFNLDERQTTSFIGLPTPANALFWGALIVGNENVFDENSYYIYLLIILVFVSSWLLVAEIPMFALKFKHWGWRDNKVKYVFLISCLPILLIFGISGISVIIAWYICLSFLTTKKNA